MDCMELRKFLKFPMRAIPSAPMKMAIALEVKNPAKILMATETEFKDATFNRTLLFM